jgi:hypothetical protein
MIPRRDMSHTVYDRRTILFIQYIFLHSSLWILEQESNHINEADATYCRQQLSIVTPQLQKLVEPANKANHYFIDKSAAAA